MIVCDKNLSKAINSKLSIKSIYKKTSDDLSKLIKMNIKVLISELAGIDGNKMAISLGHGVARHKLKFKSENIDVMIIQSIGLIDDLDKDLNTFMMRLREWYGYYFPELSSIISDAFLYSKCAYLIGDPSTIDENKNSEALATILDKSQYEDVVNAARVTMGIKIPKDELIEITDIADRIEKLVDYRKKLNLYLKVRMEKIAPNLCTIVGEIVGARLIAHAGSLMNLAKIPASTVQLLGAEKALFRALKKKSATPKYGLIYHASLVSRANQDVKGKFSVIKNVGKVARMLAAKVSLCTRIDAISGEKNDDNGIKCYEYVNRRLNTVTPKLGLSKRNETPKFESGIVEVKRRKLN